MMRFTRRLIKIPPSSFILFNKNVLNFDNPDSEMISFKLSNSRSDNKYPIKSSTFVIHQSDLKYSTLTSEKIGLKKSCTLSTFTI